MTLPAHVPATPLGRPTRHEQLAHLEPPARLRPLTPIPPPAAVTPPLPAERPAPARLPRALDLALAERHPSCEGRTPAAPCPLQGTCPIRPTCTDGADDAERPRTAAAPTVLPFSRRDDRGQATVEYGLVILVAGVLALGVIAWARGTGAFTSLFQTVIDTLTGSI
jgi:Flp pilus assembly pilin Flp